MTRETKGLLLGFIGVVIFGATLPATRLAVADLNPWFVTAGRAALAGVMAAIVLLVLRKPVPDRKHWIPIGIVSLGVGFGFPGFSSLAMQTVPASHGGVIVGILPLGTAICGALFAGDRPSAGFWAFGLLGAALVTTFALRQSGLEVTAGHVYLLLAVVSASIGYAFSGRLSREMPGWEVISWALVFAMPLSAPITLLSLPADISIVRAAAWLSFAYVTVMSMYVGFFFWNTGLAMGGVARVSQVQLLQSFVTLAISFVVLGERIDGITVLFALAVTGTVLLGRLTAVRRA